MLEPPRATAKGVANSATGPSGGIDEKRALMLLGGDRKFLEEMLVMFVDSYADFMKELAFLLVKRDFSEARRLVHGLKGASSSLGITDVQAAAAVLEERLLTGQAVDMGDVSMGALERALEVVLESIGRRAGKSD